MYLSENILSSSRILGHKVRRGRERGRTKCNHVIKNAQCETVFWGSPTWQQPLRRALLLRGSRAPRGALGLAWHVDPWLWSGHYTIPSLAGFPRAGTGELSKPHFMVTECSLQELREARLSGKNLGLVP